MKVIFFGTSSFGIPCLEALHRSGHELLAVVTKADSFGGRHREVLESPVKRRALEKGLFLLQPDCLSERSFLETLERLKSDLFVLASYGKILPSSLLALPPHGGLNLHPSLLPKYRGASPVAWAILNGDRKTGVSIARLTETVDAGELLLQKEVVIGPDEDAIQLSERLSKLAADLLIEALHRIAQGKACFIPQKGEVRVAPRLKKEDGLLDWTKSAESLYRKIRALVPWPGSFSFLHGKRMIIWKADVEKKEGSGRPGEVIEVSKKGIFRVATGKGTLLLQEIQPEGKERQGIRSYLIGHPVRPGETFSCHPGHS